MRPGKIEAMTTDERAAFIQPIRLENGVVIGAREIWDTGWEPSVDSDGKIVRITRVLPSGAVLDSASVGEWLGRYYPAQIGMAIL